MYIMQISLGDFRKKRSKKICRQESALCLSKITMLQGFLPAAPHDTQEVLVMSIPIRPEDVRTALAPMLGPRFVTLTPVCENAAHCLSLYAPSCMTLEDMFVKVKECIFGDLYNALGPGMLLTLENGVRLRLRLRDVDTLADEALGVLMDALPGDLLPLEFLRGYALQSGHLCAMRVLLQRYGAVLPSMEREMLARIIRENHPADRYSGWLE